MSILCLWQKEKCSSSTDLALHSGGWGCVDAWYRVEAECLLSCFFVPERTVRSRDEFRAPAGVRKSPRKEPTGHSQRLWIFRSVADVGDGAAADGKREVDADRPLRCSIARYWRPGAGPATRLSRPGSLLKKPVMLCRCRTTLNASATNGACPLPHRARPPAQRVRSTAPDTTFNVYWSVRR